MKNVIRKMIGGLPILLFAAGIIVAGIIFYRKEPRNFLAFPVYAKEYENEIESEYEYEKEYVDENGGSSATQTTKTKSTPIYKTIFVTKIITTLDPIFKTDKDGDNLVDGLDPHPAVPEREYFTDDDDDSIPNAFDKYPNDDDFAYYEGEKDENGDGILDSYEFMAER
jgi:hypothetical protein